MICSIDRSSAIALLALLVACGDAASDAATDTEGGGTSGDGPTGGPADSGDETGSPSGETTDGPVLGAGSCEYTNPFSGGPECRDYIGAGWDGASVQADCDAQMGTAILDAACETDGVLGRCILDGGTDLEVQIVSYGEDAGSCGITQTGCETFGGGTWEPDAVCADDDTGGGGVSNPFIQPTLECRDPVDGEAAGSGPDGQVCTWQLISASTEEGRRYEDYADCDVVYTQRPYYAAPGNDQTDDPRMDDPAYTAELDWVKAQIEASACACCHSDIAPAGSSNWTVDAEGNWVGTFDDTGLAFSAGWIDSTSFGTFPPQDNNGFDRRYGVPSTDPERMRDFFLGELEHRGLQEADFAGDPAFGGPLYDQLVYEPSRCEDGEGVARDGRVDWDGDGARYVYILEADAANPTVPPNLDLPEGTLWRIDVPWDEEEIIGAGSLRYGEVPTIANQRLPEQGAPATLTPGEDYYLYVLADVAIPITRCIFTY